MNHRRVSLAGVVMAISLAGACAISADTKRVERPAKAEQLKGPPGLGTRVVLLGTGTPNANPRRSGPAVAVLVGETPYLFDSGPGVVRRAEAAFEKGNRALAMENLSRVFITHLHSDHTLGLPDLMFSPWVLGRQVPLQVYGPPGIKAMVEHISEAYAEDIQVRLGGKEPANKKGHMAQVHEVRPGLAYEDERVRITAFQVPHGSWKWSFGYRVETKDRRIVISGDTAPSQSIVEQCDGCDVLIHEVYAVAGLNRRPDYWQAYHRTAHTSSVELAGIAARAKPKLLVLYHQLFWGVTPKQLLAEIRATYKDGQVVCGQDLDVF